MSLSNPDEYFEANRSRPAQLHLCPVSRIWCEQLETTSISRCDRILNFWPSLWSQELDSKSWGAKGVPQCLKLCKQMWDWDSSCQVLSSYVEAQTHALVAGSRDRCIFKLIVIEAMKISRCSATPEKCGACRDDNASRTCILPESSVRIITLLWSLIRVWMAFSPVRRHRILVARSLRLAGMHATPPKQQKMDPGIDTFQYYGLHQLPNDIRKCSFRI